MKKMALVSILGVALLASCQKKTEEQAPAQPPAEQPAQPPAEQPQKPPAEQPKQESTGPAKDMTAFAQQKGCFACHDVNTKKVGPAYKDVAKKFAGQPNAVEELAKRIKNGGVGVWGQVPMPPQNVTDEEAKELAQWILSLK